MAVTPRRRQRLGLNASSPSWRARKPEVISSPFHSNCVESFAGGGGPTHRGLCPDTSGVHHAIGEPIDELPPRAEEAIGSIAARPRCKKALLQLSISLFYQ